MKRTGSRVAGAKQAAGLVVLAFDLWRRLPAKRRRQLLALARKHGPKLAVRVMKSRRGHR